MADHTKEEVLALAERYEKTAAAFSDRQRLVESPVNERGNREHVTIAFALRAYAEAMSAVPVAWQWLTVDGWVGKDGTTEEYARAMAGANGRVRAIYAAPPVSAPAEPVAVKELEWVKAHGADTLLKAETVDRTYRVWTFAEAHGGWFWDCVVGFPGTLVSHDTVASEVEGKTAAQADYEACIRSALVIPPAPVAEAGAVVPAGWRLIETAPNDGQFLFLGIARRGFLEEIHIGRYSWAVNEDEENVWWSEQADDEICPTHWAPFIEVDAAPPPPAREIGEDR